MKDNKVWFITGASKGFGLSLTKQLLNAGHKVAATSRNIAELNEAVGIASDDFLPLQVDLVSEESVASALKKTYDTFKQIDVVINNAGYGIGGTIEELSDEDTRDCFDVNVFGTLNVIRKVMPYLRKQRSGHIINISSIGGLTTGAGFDIYAASKFAVIGFTEGLSHDVKGMGIKVTVVAPGAFRTSFLSSGSLVLTKHPIDDYKPVRETHTRFLAMNGQQAGDPEKAAAAIIKIAGEDEPPLYLLLGSDAYDRAMQKLNFLEREFGLNEELTKSMAFQG